ncbi:uncharacterized protein LOC127046441 isoform X4 [Gopherus flavomarginatus]|uniref:uncharacterized protein LOC127046441 isoform X2 n=2 Tax=Gopherus flavomarginatus TaxID=286002 RepID=UPI0021CBB719|nr:uncharacterized protein LOC127046441 isoform X2 [Gopherus flavomarginatus]XP_050799444.1 uncharacterized protein LOC127046441 isoform X3 [Gopherus flavomarginatus]XP_050799445.1 uncharacterized protein LOC127046441 isoform X4 [Gopherus flavomarginatus]
MVTKGPGCGAAPLTQRRVPASCCPSRARWALREPPPPPPDSEQPPLGEEGARLRRRPGWGTGGGGGAAGGSSARRGGVRSQPGYLRAARGSGRLSAQVRAQEPRSSLSLEICTAMKQPCIPSLNRLSTNQLQVSSINTRQSIVGCCSSALLPSNPKDKSCKWIPPMC